MRIADTDATRAKFVVVSWIPGSDIPHEAGLPLQYLAGSRTPVYTSSTGVYCWWTYIRINVAEIAGYYRSV